jgi:hypothetical protein
MIRRKKRGLRLSQRYQSCSDKRNRIRNFLNQIQMIRMVV